MEWAHVFVCVGASVHERGRMRTGYTIYIAQNYFRLPQHTIRENPNFIILFPQDVKNLTHIHVDHCPYDISLLEFKQFCHGVWSNEKHNSITIDFTITPMDGKYRHNLQPVGKYHIERAVAL